MLCNFVTMLAMVAIKGPLSNMTGGQHGTLSFCPPVGKGWPAGG